MSAARGLPSGRRLLVLSLIAMAAYAVVGALTLTVGQYSGLASPVWPAAGLAFAFVYEYGWRLAPAVLLGSILSNLATLGRQETLTATALAVTVAIGVGAALQAMVGSTLVTRAVGRRASLTSGGQIVAFLLLAGPVGSVVNATIATIAQLASGLLSADQALVLWVTWWAGDAIGIVVFAPLVLMLLPGQRAVWVGRRIGVAIPALVGVTLFAGFFVQADLQARHERELRLEQLAAEAAGELERNVARHQEVLEGLSSFFESSDEVDVDEFATFTKSALERYPNLQALSWNPVLTADEVSAFEEYQREQQGLEGFTVTERDADGNLIPVTPRDEYVTVGYIEPLDANRAALGFDINSNPTRKEAIDRARDLGEPSATGPITLVQESGSQSGMLALVPVYEGGARPADATERADALRGFAVGVYELADLLDDTFTSPTWNRVEIRLVDVTEMDEPAEIAVRSAVVPATIDLTRADDSAMASDVFTVYGRTWQVEVLPTSGALANPNRALAPSIDVVGLILLTLLQAFILVVTGLERVATRQAEHADREANTDELTGLQNRRAFLRNLALVRQRSIADGSTGVLLYLDLDRFKAINDKAGHEAGDRMLQGVARVMSENVRSRDVVARIGGDEFAIILNNCELDRGVAIAETLAEKVCGLVIGSSAGGLNVGVSIGLTGVRPDGGQDIDELIRQADDACYDAKNNGGGVRVGGVSASDQ